MSEYQYYEFRAVDRRLTGAEMDRLRTYSSRAEITATSFVNEYHWGDSKGDEDQWMERYFDAFLYFANWGTRIFKLRLPARELDPECVRAYCDDHALFFRKKDGNVVLTFCSDENDGEDPPELAGSRLLSALISLRSELARGDLRALYLGWLVTIRGEDFDSEVIEPPLPAGLTQLSASLETLADFLLIDPDLLHVAAQASQSRRTVGALLRATDKRAAEREQAAARKAANEKTRKEREAASARKKRLDQLADQEPRLWADVGRLAATKLPKNYDQATNVLVDLRDLASRSGDNGSAEFATQLEHFRATHARKPSLLERLTRASL